MSDGSLSHNAICALNKGAKQGGFSHNTVEGSLSPFHLEAGGDIVWQIGTGYFGCRTSEGSFYAELFAKNAAMTGREPTRKAGSAFTYRLPILQPGEVLCAWYCH